MREINITRTKLSTSTEKRLSLCWNIDDDDTTEDVSTRAPNIEITPRSDAPQQGGNRSSSNQGQQPVLPKVPFSIFVDFPESD